MQQKVFEELFDRYLQNTITEMEKKQLMDIIKNQEYEEFVKEKIVLLLENKENTARLDKQKSDGILTFILSSAQGKVVSIHSRKKRKKQMIRAFLTIAASIALLLGIKNIVFRTNTNETAPTKVEQVTEKEDPILVFTGKQLIHLPDGSTILLNDTSSIQYDQTTFNDKTREVRLYGEAYFDIKHNKSKPFIVHTGKVHTEVLGTAFNINAYKTSQNIEITVTRGKVQVGDSKKVYAVITPNQQITVNKNTLSYQQNMVDAEEIVKWKSNYLILENSNMEEAIAQISVKYKVAITLANENIKNCRITASFLNEENLDHVLKVICSVIETNYHYTENGSIVIDGKGCE
jgi:transmembrane sensor